MGREGKVKRGTKKIWHRCLKEERHKYIAAAKCVVGHYIVHTYYAYTTHTTICTTHACTNSGSGWVGT